MSSEKQVAKKLKDEEKEAFWHSTSHVLADAVKRIWPKVKLGMGPAIENGFYYDFDKKEPFTAEDLEKIEAEMKKIIKENLKFENVKMSRKEAEAMLKKKGEKYKLELLKEIPDKEISFNKHGNFIDLCNSPMIRYTTKIKAFKLLNTTTAYWRGDSKNPVLQRIYGISFPSKAELEDYLAMQEELKKRDHRRIGKELDLFCFSEIVGSGLPLFTPKGTIIIDELQKHIETVCKKYGFQKVKTPHIAKRELFEISGHAIKFSEELFSVTSPKKHEFALKPVQCPHQTQIYASRPRSYKDLPIRYMESDKQYRAEKTGEIGGLNRVYAITVEDGHSFCTVDQVKQEVMNIIDIIKEFYTALGLWDNVWVSLSVRDYSHPEKYIGEKEDWDTCEAMLEEISKKMKLNAKKCEGEAALYGPKLDFMFKDAMGKEIQIPTVQLDFATPKRFNLVYTNKDGKESTPVMVHRAILGSYERFLVLLIEHFAGAFPVWLSPVQVRITTIADRHEKYAQKLKEELLENDIRADINSSQNTIEYKIRDAELEKVPYIIVVGDKEQEKGTLAIRRRGEKKVEYGVKKDKFIKEIKEKISKLN